MANVDNPSTDVIWLGDTRASHHTTHDMVNYSTFEKMSTPYKIKQVQGEVHVTHCGTVNLIVQSATGPRPLLLKEVLYIPNMNFNLFSLQKIIKENYIPVFDEMKEKCIIKKTLPTGHKEQIALLTIIEGRPTLECHLAPRTPLALAPPALYVGEVSMSLLHRRLGHSGQPALKRLISEDMETGFKVVQGSDVDPCDACELGKLTRPTHPPRPFMHNTSFPLQLVVMDLAGPVRPRTLVWN